MRYNHSRVIGYVCGRSAARLLSADFRPLLHIFHTSLLMLSLPLLALAQDPEPTADPPELVALREAFERRKTAALRPLADQYARQVDGILQRLLQSQRARDALVVQRYLDAYRRTGVWPELSAEAPAELSAAQANFLSLSENHVRPIQSAYLAQLDALQKSLLRQQNLLHAAAVEREIAALRAATAPSTTFVWEEERKKVKYSYSHARFYKGTFDYSDRAGRKLTDGKIGEIPSEDTVAWGEWDPPLIRVEFTRPVTPTRFRIHVMGGGKWNMVVNREIRIWAGADPKTGMVVGAIKNPENRTQWIEIPLQVKTAQRVFWVELIRDQGHTVIDEFEFH